jgi:hypothetical protein
VAAAVVRIRYPHQPLDPNSAKEGTCCLVAEEREASARAHPAERALGGRFRESIHGWTSLRPSGL